MVTFNQNLRYSSNLKQKYRRFVTLISHQKYTCDIYCIAFATNGVDLLDIYLANELLFPHYESVPIHIIGIAKGKTEALHLVHDILHEVYRETGGFSLREYFGEESKKDKR